jgi:hypothetical protein
MALARCEKCGRPTKNVSPPAHSAQPYPPVNHPDSGVVCGTVGCENAAVVWLKPQEVNPYQLGQRVFEFATNAAKVMLSPRWRVRGVAG